MPDNMINFWPAYIGLINVDHVRPTVYTIVFQPLVNSSSTLIFESIINFSFDSILMEKAGSRASQIYL